MSVSEIEAKVKTTRAQYDASVQELQSRLAKLPAAVDKLGKLDTRLEGLEEEVSALRREMKDLSSKTSVRTASSGAASPASSASPSNKKAFKRSVSWNEKEAEVSNIPDRFGNGDELQDEPPQPTNFFAKRGSCLSSSSFADMGGASAGLPGSRLVTLQTNSDILGPLECILSEPLGKQVSPENYITTGLIICLHGNAPSPDVLAEWTTAMEQVRWLDLGTSIALPNLEMTPTLTVEDLECLVEATLELVAVKSCIIVGKAWGALRAIQVATSERLMDKIEGVVLVAPSSPAPEVCADVIHPVLLVWGHDDDTEDFSNAEEWMEALDGRDAPTSMVEVARGGHHIGNLMENAEASAAVRNFTVASLLSSDLEAAASSDSAGLSERARRLASELPGFLMAQSGGDFLVDSEAVKSGQMSTEMSTSQMSQARRGSQRLSALLPQWVASGMPTSSE